jgi:LacI family transcriptional regulator
VVNDNVGIGKAAAAFFLNLGNFRSFAFIPDELDRSWSAERGKAFGDELAAHGKSCTFYTCGKKGSAGEKALAQFLNGLEKPAAVFAAWDGRAADALHAARVARLRVPEEISVLGVDDDKLICEHTRPALSSIRTDAEGMGEEAARLLAGMIRSGRTTLRKPITRPILNIIERDSTRTPVPAAQLIRRATAFIEAEAHKDIRPEDVARGLNVSRRLLDLRFREYEHMSLSEKIIQRKIETAKRLLTESSIAVKDVFRSAGFASVTNANKIFKTATGLTPAAWRLRGANPPGGGENRRRPPFQILEEISGADERDLNALTSLLDPSAEFDAASLRQSMRDGSATVFVKRTRGRIVAAAAIARFSTPTGTHHRIEDVIVHPTLRGKGIGKKMMTHLLDHLRSRQAKSVELTSRPSRVAANALYRSLGFARRETNVYEYRFGRD